MVSFGAGGRLDKGVTRCDRDAGRARRLRDEGGCRRQDGVRGAVRGRKECKSKGEGDVETNLPYT